MMQGADAVSARTRHPARRVRADLSLLALVVLAALAFGGCSSSGSGLPQPFADAVTVMQEVDGYSFAGTIDAGGTAASTVTVSGHFQAPNRVAQNVARSGSSPVSMVLDGSTVHVLDPSTGAWTTRPSTSSEAVDLRQAFTALASARHARIDGSSATFTVRDDAARTLAGESAGDEVEVTITLGSVGLSGLTYRAKVDGRPVTVALTYTDVGTAPKVTIPT